MAWNSRCKWKPAVALTAPSEPAPCGALPPAPTELSNHAVVALRAAFNAAAAERQIDEAEFGEWVAKQQPRAVDRTSTSMKPAKGSQPARRAPGSPPAPVRPSPRALHAPLAKTSAAPPAQPLPSSSEVLISVRALRRKLNSLYTVVSAARGGGGTDRGPQPLFLRAGGRQNHEPPSARERGRERLLLPRAVIALLNSSAPATLLSWADLMNAGGTPGERATHEQPSAHPPPTREREAAAAAKIQARARGKASRKEGARRANAATTVQRHARGKAARRRAERKAALTASVRTAAGTAAMAEQSAAASVIQRRARDRQQPRALVAPQRTPLPPHRAQQVQRPPLAAARESGAAVAPTGRIGTSACDGAGTGNGADVAPPPAAAPPAGVPAAAAASAPAAALSQPVRGLQRALSVAAGGWAFATLRLQETSVRWVDGASEEKEEDEGSAALAGTRAQPAVEGGTPSGDEARDGARGAAGASMACTLPLKIVLHCAAPAASAAGAGALPELYLGPPGGDRPSTIRWHCRSVRADAWSRARPPAVGVTTSVRLLPPERARAHRGGDAEGRAAAASGAGSCRVGEGAPGLYTVGVRLPQGARGSCGLRLRLELLSLGTAELVELGGAEVGGRAEAEEVEQQQQPATFGTQQAQQAEERGAAAHAAHAAVPEHAPFARAPPAPAAAPALAAQAVGAEAPAEAEADEAAPAADGAAAAQQDGGAHGLPSGMASYRGSLACGLPTGIGECVYADGSRYAGGFWYGRRNGPGTFCTADGSGSVRGLWKEDLPWRAAADGRGAFVANDAGSGVRSVGASAWVAEVWHVGNLVGVFASAQAAGSKPVPPAASPEPAAAAAAADAASELEGAGGAPPLRVFGSAEEAEEAFAAEAGRWCYSHCGGILHGRRHGIGRSEYAVSAAPPRPHGASPPRALLSSLRAGPLGRRRPCGMLRALPSRPLLLLLLHARCAPLLRSESHSAAALLNSRAALLTCAACPPAPLCPLCAQDGCFVEGCWVADSLAAGSPAFGRIRLQQGIYQGGLAPTQGGRGGGVARLVPEGAGAFTLAPSALHAELDARARLTPLAGATLSAVAESAASLPLSSASALQLAQTWRTAQAKAAREQQGEEAEGEEGDAGDEPPPPPPPPQHVGAVAPSLPSPASAAGSAASRGQPAAAVPGAQQPPVTDAPLSPASARSSGGGAEAEAELPPPPAGGSRLVGEWRAGQPFRSEGEGGEAGSAWWRHAPSASLVWYYRGSWQGGLRHGSGTCVYYARRRQAHTANGASTGGAEGSSSRAPPPPPRAGEANAGAQPPEPIATFRGEWRRGRWEGHGTLRTTAPARVLVGEFSGGLRSAAVRVELTPGGCVYSGHLADGLRSGVGMSVERTADGGASGSGGDSGERPPLLEYLGEWADDLPHGVGTRTDRHGIFEGQFAVGVPHGRGVLRASSGAVFRGTWDRGVMDGPGRALPAAGGAEAGGGARRWTEGVWVRGSLDLASVDSGGARLEGGGWYEGGLLEGVPHGKGMARWPNGDTIDGQWAHGEPDPAQTAMCVRTAPNGDRYVGEARGGTSAFPRPHGFGALTTASGDHCEGLWSDGMPLNCAGVVTIDGQRYEGAWRAGVRSGQGRLRWPTGDEYEGQFVDGLPHGRGEHRYADGSRYHGHWQRGLPHGRGRLTEPNGRVVDGEWSEGKQVV